MVRFSKRYSEKVEKRISEYIFDVLFSNANKEMNLKEILELVNKELPPSYRLTSYMLAHRLKKYELQKRVVTGPLIIYEIPNKSYIYWKKLSK